MTYSIPKQRRRITLQFLTRVVGGVPTDPKLIEGWLKANLKDKSDEELSAMRNETLKSVQSGIPGSDPLAVQRSATTAQQANEGGASSGMWTTFKRDEKGLYLESRQLKAAFKEAANILRETFIKQERKGRATEAKADKSRFTGLRSKLAERLWVDGEKVHLMQMGEPFLKHFTSPSGTEERPIHVMTAQGERSALKRFDYVENAVIVFDVSWLDDGVIGDDILNPMLEYMGLNGLGADRSQGEGTFKVVSVETVAG